MQYGLKTDASGFYAAMYKPYYLIGLELGISVASVALRKEATGATTAFKGDAVACAKRDLALGEVLDGEGGFTAYGKLMPATESLRIGALPIGLAHQLTLKNAIRAGQTITWKDVVYDSNHHAIRIRKLMEAEFK
jgi:predicted homoserine dehydrogenase-like protein